MTYLIELPDLPIRINARGEWLHGDEPLHPRAEQLFRKHVVVDEAGAYSLRIGFNEAPIEVDDTAFFVRSVALYKSTDGNALRKVDLVISDESQEELDPRTLMQSEDNVFYCRVFRHNLWVPCRFPSYHYHALALSADMDDSGAFFQLGGERAYIRGYDPRPVRELRPS